MTITTDNDFLTLAELARRWRTTEQAIYSARHRGDGPPALRIGRRLLYRILDIEAWEQVHLEAREAGRDTMNGPV